MEFYSTGMVWLGRMGGLVVAAALLITGLETLKEESEHDRRINA